MYFYNLEVCKNKITFYMFKCCNNSSDVIRNTEIILHVILTFSQT